MSPRSQILKDWTLPQITACRTKGLPIGSSSRFTLQVLKTISSIGSAHVPFLQLRSSSLVERRTAHHQVLPICSTLHRSRSLKQATYQTKIPFISALSSSKMGKSSRTATKMTMHISTLSKVGHGLRSDIIINFLLITLIHVYNLVLLL